jgi:hypothetical protein
MERHPIVWTQPAPFWTETTTQLFGVAPAEFGQPAILRFTTDNFMDDLMNVLATDPRRLGEYRVGPETWRGFVAPPAPLTPKKIFALPFQRLGVARKNSRNGATTLPTRPPENKNPERPPLKLYGPAAQRYYFISACLVCQTPGLPDRHVEPARAERVSFLVRRILPPGKDASRPKNEWEEHAWVQSPGGYSWRRLASGERAAPIEGEERLPMFALNFKNDDLRQRRLFAGLIPVGKRESYLGGPLATNGTTPGASIKTARKILFRKEIAEPWKAVVQRAANVATQTSEDKDVPSGGADLRNNAERAQIQTVSWLILSDFDRFLREYLPGVHNTIHGLALIEPLKTEERELQNALNQIKVGSALATVLKDPPGRKIVATSMSDALNRIATFAAGMEKTVSEYVRGKASSGWPNFLFPLADPDPAYSSDAPSPPASIVPAFDTDEQADLTGPADRIDNLTALVVRALPNTAPPSEPAVPAAAVAPADVAEGWFVLRCAYERPACGPLHDDVVSAPTEPFQLAGFFDPDAPARPIRIGLPLDISPAGLRKFDKNTAFVMSDMLCGQLKRFRGITFGDLVRSVLPFPFHKDLSVAGGPPCTSANNNPIGTICSLSIPIITICALILLIIIVSLLDFIFRWLPFFIVCFPIPGLRGKK